MPVFGLSCHAGYRCRHRGACCTANWPIPVEVDRLARLRSALATGALSPAIPVPASEIFALPDEAPPDAPAVLAIVDHTCVFFDAARGRLCRIHEALGHDALPLACRQFPRVTLRDPRGTSVTLSHFCPTAAAMLEIDAPVSVVATPAGFPAAGEYEGLDARSSLPPLLRPEMLMDWESWWEFERSSVDLLANRARTAAEALSQLRAAVDDVRRWRPDDGPLVSRVRDAFGTTGAGLDRDAGAADETMRAVVDAVPQDLRDADATLIDRVRSAGRGTRSPSARRDDGALRRFLAAHAFANWTAHLGQGLRTWLGSLEAAHTLVASGLDFRQTDLLLRHLADPKALALRLALVERR